MKKLHTLYWSLLTLCALIALGLFSCTKPPEEWKKDPTKALPHTKRHTADVAAQWMMVLTEITRTKPYTSGQTSRITTYSALALYESVNPGMPSHRSIYQQLTGNSIQIDKKKDYFWPACANAAIARVSTKIMQQYPTPNLSAVQALEASLNTSYQSFVSPERLQYSNEFGVYVADLIWEWSKSDGTFNPDGTLSVCPPYVLLGTPGKWVPVPPAFLPAAGACQGNLRTFVPNINNTVLPPPPPAYSTEVGSTFYTAAKEVQDARANITIDQTNQYNNWRDFAPNFSPIAHMLRISTGIFLKEGLNLEEAATMYAKLTMAASDAIGASFFAKYNYSIIRPVTYVRGPLGQTTWLSLPNTPQTPSYPEESSATASSIALLEKRFGSRYAFVDSVHKSTHGEWSYKSLDEMMDAIIQARVSGGTNFRFAGEAGEVQGRKVADLIEKIPFLK